MTRTLAEPVRPRGRDNCALIRSAREGTYWQAGDGLIVRLTAAETPANAAAAQRALLELACREAAERERK